MLSVQWKFGTAVVKARRRQSGLPSAGGMATLAGCRYPVDFGVDEGAFVGVGVAILASCES